MTSTTSTESARRRAATTSSGAKRSRASVASRSAVMLGGAALALAPTAAAEASHGGTANSGILNTTNWRICAPGFSPPANPAVAVNWGTAVWNDHPELAVTQVCADFNVFVQTGAYPDFWAGNTTCTGAIDANRNCPGKFVVFNSAKIDTVQPPATVGAT